MKITKHGDKYKKEPYLEEFECRNCGCEFSVKEDEYYTDFGVTSYDSGISLTYTVSNTIEDRLVCSCPECHKIVKKTKRRPGYAPYTVTCGGVTTATTTSVGAPKTSQTTITCNSTK